MGKFGGPTPKRHRIWGSDPSQLQEISLRAGRMTRAEQSSFQAKTARQYIDSRGQKRMVGNKSVLTESQTLAFEIVS